MAEYDKPSSWFILTRASLFAVLCAAHQGTQFIGAQGTAADARDFPQLMAKFLVGVGLVAQQDVVAGVDKPDGAAGYQ